jgi:hypothetical protein
LTGRSCPGQKSLSRQSSHTVACREPHAERLTDTLLAHYADRIMLTKSIAGPNHYFTLMCLEARFRDGYSRNSKVERARPLLSLDFTTVTHLHLSNGLLRSATFLHERYGSAKDLPAVGNTLFKNHFGS